MAVKLIGDTVTISAGGSDTITLTPDVDVSVTAILLNKTGRCKITRIEFPTPVELLKGSLEIDQLGRDSGRYQFPEAVPVGKGQDCVFHLTDISGATNVVYIAIECTF